VKNRIVLLRSILFTRDKDNPWKDHYVWWECITKGSFRISIDISTPAAASETFSQQYRQELSSLLK
jgi:hypothetical protein